MYEFGGVVDGVSVSLCRGRGWVLGWQWLEGGGSCGVCSCVQGCDWNWEPGIDARSESGSVEGRKGNRGSKLTHQGAPDPMVVNGSTPLWPARIRVKV